MSQEFPCWSGVEWGKKKKNNYEENMKKGRIFWKQNSKTPVETNKLVEKFGKKSAIQSNNAPYVLGCSTATYRAFEVAIG